MPMLVLPLIFSKCCYFSHINAPTNPAVYNVDLFMSSDVAESYGYNYDSIINFSNPGNQVSSTIRNLNPAYQDVKCTLPMTGRNLSDVTSTSAQGQIFYCHSEKTPERSVSDCQIGVQVQVNIPDKQGNFPKPNPQNVTVFGELCHMEDFTCKYYMDKLLVSTAFGDINLLVLIAICFLGFLVLLFGGLWYFKWRLHGFPWIKKDENEIYDDVDEPLQINTSNIKSKKRTPEFYKNFTEKYKTEYMSET